ncbi:MAG: YceI family protein [Chloroflexota bacterium]
MRKALIAAPITLIVLIVAAAAVWYFVIRDDASPLSDPLPIPTSLLNTSATATPTPRVTQAGETAAPTTITASGSGQTWAIVAGQSEADYYVGETLASLGVPSTANGKTSDISGTFFLTADGTALDTTQTSSFTVDVTTLQSDQDRRDTRVQNALETGQFPTATFTATGISGLDTSQISDDNKMTFQLNGTLELHGVTKDVTWTVEATRQSNVMSAIANLDFNFSDFGIDPPSIGGFVSVQDHGTLQAVIIAQMQ